MALNLTPEQKFKHKLLQAHCDLLWHKYLYYRLDAPVLTDAEYDECEKTIKRITRSMGLGRPFDVHDMIGFNPEHPLWQYVYQPNTRTES